MLNIPHRNQIQIRFLFNRDYNRDWIAVTSRVFPTSKQLERKPRPGSEDAIVLGSRMGHFCSIEAVRSTMNEKTSLRSLSSASSTLVWNSPLEIQSFLIASHGWNKSLAGFLLGEDQDLLHWGFWLPSAGPVSATISRYWILEPCKIILTSSASFSWYQGR